MSKPKRPRRDRSTSPERVRRAKPAVEARDRGSDSPRRLQAVLAAAGMGSRRQCEELIVAGRVEVDGKTVTELGTKVDSARQQVKLDGIALPKPKLVYYAVNKPPGVVCTNFDPSGAPRVIDLLPPTDEHVYTVGRLDKSSEGLILVTNDGPLADRLTHPRYGVEKAYQVVVAGVPSPEVLRQLREGVRLTEGIARATEVRIRTTRKQSATLEMVLREGRNREIRRVLARVGHKVLRLKRIAIGDLRLKTLPVGTYRKLVSAEVALLEKAAKTSHRSNTEAPPQVRGGSRRRLEQARRRSAGGKSGSSRSETAGGAKSPAPRARKQAKVRDR